MTPVRQNTRYHAPRACIKFGYVEHIEIVGSNTWSSQTNDLYNCHLVLPSQVLGIITIGLGLVGSLSG